MGLITDIDGTIAPIAPRPDEALVSPICCKSLAALASRMALVATISGRSALKSRQMLGIDTLVYVGNHGLDMWRGGHVEIEDRATKYSSVFEGLVENLGQHLDIRELVMEAKGLSASVHYRLSRDPQRAREVILSTIKTIPEAEGLLITEGKQVVEIRPPVPVDKGTSIRYLMSEYKLNGVLCIGDDVTDLDAFRALRKCRQAGECLGLSFGVIGEDSPPELEQEADLLLRGVNEVEEFLQRILELYGTEPKQMI